MIFTCPICKGKLNISSEGAAVCPSGHSYDRGRGGYYNLLQGGGNHGDNKEMVIARRSFLSRGFYDRLAKRLGELAIDLVPDGGVILDSGCGEGYYTSHLRRGAEMLGKGVYIAGFDISRDAVRETAKKKCADALAVASAYKIPIPDASCDLVLNVFSPLALDEMRRVLRRGGTFIMAIPGEDHLFGLKEKIYDTPYKNKVEDTDIDGFRIIRREELRFTLPLATGEDVRDLFMMTPYAYRTSKEGRERVLSLSGIDVEAHFIILLYEKA